VLGVRMHVSIIEPPKPPNVRSNVVPGWIPGGRDVISALRRGVRAAFL